jgi:hypothetical protein
MATVSHASLTADADLHEPKGAFSASAGEVYIADGAGSGSFQVGVIGPTNFTPVLRFGGTNILSGGGSFTTIFSKYSRLFNTIMVEIVVSLTAKGSATGEFTIDTPFPVSLGGPGTAIIGSSSGISSTVVVIPNRIANNVSFIEQNASSLDVITNANLTNSSSIQVTFIFERT